MKKVKFTKYSTVFYRQSIKKFVVVLTCIAIALFLLFGFLLVRSNVTENKINMKKECENAYTALDAAMKNCAQFCTHFSTIERVSLVFDSQMQTDLYRSVLKEEMRSVISSFDYITYIAVSSTEHHIASGHMIGDPFSHLMDYQGYKINYLKDADWPAILQVEFLYESVNPVTVKLDLNIVNIGRENFSENTYFVAEDGTVIACRDSKQIGKSIYVLYPAERNTFLEEPLKYMSTAVEFSGSGAKILTVKPTLELISTSVYQIFLLLSAFAVTLIISATLLFKMVKATYAPIEKSMEILKYYIFDNNTLAADDIDFIMRQMPDDAMNEKAKKTVSQLRQSQLHTLHSQISPHFLGNSLEVIKLEINNIIGNHNRIEESLSTLSMFLHDAHEYQKMIVPLVSEVEKTKRYVDMMAFCFSRGLQVDWDIEEELLSAAVIGITFQPILENSIIHGFAGCSRVPHICVRVYSQWAKHTNRKEVVVQVKDNGSGIEPEVLRDLKFGILNGINNNKHIGLKNTHQKYRLLFGEGYGIQEIRSDHTGTTVMIRFPYCSM